MLAVTFLLVVLVLLMMVQLPNMYDQSVPAIFKITKISYDSKMVVMNTGSSGFKNRNLAAETYRNGVNLNCRIPTFHGSDFISTHHFKIQTLGGPGSRDNTWDPDEMVSIDYKNGIFRPRDVVTFEVYDTVSGQIISRHTYTA
jgi:hypothetical protein